MTGRFNKSELVRMVSEITGVSRSVVGPVVDTFLEIIVVMVRGDFEVNIRNFGNFEPRIRKRTVRFVPSGSPSVVRPHGMGLILSPSLKDFLNLPGPRDPGVRWFFLGPGGH